MRIKNLKTLTTNDTSLYGGKAVNLAKLINFGFNVPEGFVIPANLEVDKHKDEIFKNFDELKTNCVAVRSSANCEDSNSLSFAGIFESYLNVSKSELIKTIIKCRESLNTNRAKTYVSINNINSTELNLGVIVQKMISADYSGVIFTQDPYSSQKMIIEVVEGLGKNIVGGVVTPGSYSINKKSLKLEKRGNLNRKKLNKNIIDTLVTQSLEIEGKLGYSVDIEFSIKNQNIYYLQVRPITTI